MRHWAYNVLHPRLTRKHANSLQPLEVDVRTKQFGAQVSIVVCSRDMVDINQTLIDTVSYEVHSDIDVFHGRMLLRVVCAIDSPTVVAVE